MSQAALELIFKFIAGSASACACGVSTLHHKVGYHAMKLDTFIISLARQEDKVIDCLWCLISKQLDDHGTFICIHLGLVFLLGINLHFWGGIPLLCHFLSLFKMRNELFKFRSTFFC